MVASILKLLSIFKRCSCKHLLKNGTVYQVQIAGIYPKLFLLKFGLKESKGAQYYLEELLWENASMANAPPCPPPNVSPVFLSVNVWGPSDNTLV